MKSNKYTLVDKYRVVMESEKNDVRIAEDQIYIEIQGQNMAFSPNSLSELVTQLNSILKAHKKLIKYLNDEHSREVSKKLKAKNEQAKQ